MLNRRYFVAALVSSTCLGGIASAQAGLFDKAKDALGGLKTLTPGGSADVLSNDDIAAGLREALRIGSERVVAQVGAFDGFNADPQIHIPLPGALLDVQKMLGRFGMSDLADDLETRLNRGAEAAAPEAKELFLNAIGEMSLDDVRGILDGPDDAATQYFKGKMSTPLSARMEPIVDRNLSEVGAIAAYDKMMGQYDAIPLVPDVKADLTSYVVEKGLEGIFFYVAKEEAAIRKDPAKRTTELLQRVFGS
jgi:uncharacterized protein DUF4197